jgi:hypothetical protein
LSVNGQILTAALNTLLAASAQQLIAPRGPFRARDAVSSPGIIFLLFIAVFDISGAGRRRFLK